jgi:hypothetical protein
MSFNSQLNANVVKTALDGVFNQTFSGEQHPGHVTAESGIVFNQDTADSSAVIMELFKGVGAWDSRSEEQDVQGGTPRIGNQKTFSVVNFAKSVDIPKNFFDDNKHSSYENMIRNFALRARTTRDKNAFALFRNPSTAALFGTSDGVALLSASHTNLNGDTVSNLVTGALSETTLNDAIVKLLEMKSQDGEIDGFMPKTLLVPPKLFKTACEIAESELRSGTGNNDMNVYSTKYGVYVATSQYLGAAAGGSDTAWFLLSTNHSVNRYVRTPVFTDLVDYKFQRNNSYIYKGEFREVVGAMSYEGLVGSLGT